VPQPDGRVGLSFSVSEWAELSDGRRVVLHEAIGFDSVLSGDEDPWTHYDADLVRSGVLSAVLPDEDDGEDHPWDWLLELLADQGVVASEAELRSVPYDVEFGPEVTRRVSAGA
jgi:hypothetical protein